MVGNPYSMVAYCVNDVSDIHLTSPLGQGLRRCYTPICDAIIAQTETFVKSEFDKSANLAIINPTSDISRPSGQGEVLSAVRNQFPIGGVEPVISWFRAREP